MWSNADEVDAFIGAHKDRQWVVGDRFVLPDIEQAYEVIAVRPFKRRGVFRLFVDLEARCAIETCEEYFITAKEVHQWMTSLHVTRCCPAHRFAFSTPMRDAWMTQERREARPVRSGRVEGPKRVGRIESAVLEAVAALSLVEDSASVASVIGCAIARLEAGEGRDTRRQVVVRAVHRMVRRGALVVAAGRVLF